MPSLRPVAAALLLQLPAALAAQQPATQPGGRFEQDLNPRTRIEGLTPAEAREWNAVVDRVAAVLRANPAVNSPPAGICTRLSTWVGEFVVGARMRSAPTVQIPVSYDGRTCSRISNGAVTVYLNGFGHFLGIAPGRDVQPEEQRALRERIFVLPPTEGGVGPGARYQDSQAHMVVLTHGREPLTLPVSKEEYLRRRIAEAERTRTEIAAMPAEPMFDRERWLREEKPQMQAEFRKSLRELEEYLPPEEIQRRRENFERFLAQMEATMREVAARQPEVAAVRDDAAARTQGEVQRLRAALDALSPEQRRAPACYSADPMTLLGDCAGASRPYVTLNPRYFDDSLPRSAVQLIVVSSPMELRGKEDPRHYQLRQRIFETLDYAALAQLLRR